MLCFLAGVLSGLLGLVALMAAGFGFSLSIAACVLDVMPGVHARIGRTVRRRLTSATLFASAIWFAALIVGASRDELDLWLEFAAIPPICLGVIATFWVFRDSDTDSHRSAP
jgi:hypothetical protein